MDHDPPKRIAIISTGGTIEKTYDAFEGILTNSVNVLDIMLAQLQLRGVVLTRVPLMNKDSLTMTRVDHDLIARTVEAMSMVFDGVLVVHGTDRLQHSGEHTCALLTPPRVPVVFTGAMRPYELRSTDALQNVTEALLAVQLLPPGVYAAFHNQIHRFPGVVKDHQRGCFVSHKPRARLVFVEDDEADPDASTE